MPTQDSPLDIDWQLRYGETETQAVAEFLGYTQNEEIRRMPYDQLMAKLILAIETGDRELQECISEQMLDSEAHPDAE